MTLWNDLRISAGLAPLNIGHLSKAAVKSGPLKPATSASPSTSDIEITPEYEEILGWLNDGAPIVFVTGKAGTGKTTLIRYLRENFQDNSVIVAPTGVAALNVGGVTIHSLFRFPPRLLTEDDVKVVRDRKLFRQLRFLIIDEISMVRADVIDAIDLFLRRNRESAEPFGGVQLLMVGDLFQLPPVLQRREIEALEMLDYDSPYFFSAKALRRCSMLAKELTKIYRQSEEGFIATLNHVRVAESLDQVLPLLNARFVPVDLAAGALITLACTNRVADEINELELSKLPTNPRTFTGEVSGKFALGDEKLPSPLNLALKVGAQVMFTKNDEKKRWVNGTLGRVVGFEVDVIRVEIGDALGVDVHDVRPAQWESYKYEFDTNVDKIIPVSTGTYRQYPLMLAWAVTIHKSQGKTLDKVCLNLGDGAFSPGQVYVALSRCRKLEDIYLQQPIRPADIKCDPVIKRFYAALGA